VDERNPGSNARKHTRKMDGEAWQLGMKNISDIKKPKHTYIHSHTVLPKLYSEKIHSSSFSS
jgi:hypothetical protein